MNIDDLHSSVQAHQPGRVLLSNPSIARIPKIKQILSAAGWTPHRKTPERDDALALIEVAPPQDEKGLWIGAAFIPDQPCPQVVRPAPLGITIDTRGSVHNADHPSDLELILATTPLDNAAILQRARNLAEHLRMLQLCKNPVQAADIETPKVPFVLVLDQPQNDPCLPPEPQATDQLREMLVLAHEAHPHADIIVFTPNQDENGAITGHFEGADSSPNVTLFTQPANPWHLFEFATAVYTVSSPLGFDAILAGHKPHVFGRPWYAGWGLTQDHTPIARRSRSLTRAQLVAGAMYYYCKWFDPNTKSLCSPESALARADARHRAAMEDRHGYVASNMLFWKRRHLRRFFGSHAITFTNSDSKIQNMRNQGARHMTWGARTDATVDLRVEDGFLRSRGLGAALVRPLSLICDDLGQYFDPTHASRLEALVHQSCTLAPHAKQRIDALINRLIHLRLSKYNVESQTITLPKGYKVLVAGQVENDASILLAAGSLCTNLGLLQAARAAHPQAVIVFKPHPDVEARLRRGKVENATEYADVVAHDADPIALIEACDEVWTMTSLIGFEALIRGKPVTCTGAPFYAGWGLTTDLGTVPARRGARPSVLGLAHAALIDYPRYFDPATGAAISVEDAVELLASGPMGRSKWAQNALSKLRQFRARFLGLDR
ncbi:capsular polysaccharide export protein [Pacificibacter maritimus]|uniref:Capsular polysaccharide export protein n=1 Tax=Pacificibacter maritimus TaxID=762213 RepID=A0A3N4UWS8_9RHOB|nr:capsular polysaccharide biosynthesis protein [Pacificibacter maritimus]RPE71999.1 capsular polysaccharide export protein [Pacificibacter maritimus]